jgi:hypothetical protein
MVDVVPDGVSGPKGTREMTISFENGGFEDATTVLALAPEVGTTTDRTSARLFGPDGESVDRVVAVTVTGSAADWLDAWDRHGSATTPVTCVDVDGETRSTADVERGATGANPEPAPASATVERVSSPRNLERVGREASDVLQRADEGSERVGLAVHSVSGLLQHVDESTAFKFVYSLGEIVRKVDGVACFYIDPDAHDEETVGTFTVVCDAVAELDCDLAARDATE